MFKYTISYNTFGYVHKIGEKNFMNILRRQNELNYCVKAIALHDVDKMALKNILKQSKDGIALLDALHDMKLIQGIEAAFNANKVWFLGTSNESIKECLRTFIIPELKRGGNDEAHMGGNQIDDLPQVEVDTMIAKSKRIIKIIPTKTTTSRSIRHHNAVPVFLLYLTRASLHHHKNSHKRTLHSKSPLIHPLT